jgi:hypothetical protein
LIKCGAEIVDDFLGDDVGHDLWKAIPDTFSTSCHSLICPLAWDNVPYTSARLFDVARSSWNQVDMAMVNGLARGFAHIDANIETGDAGILRFCSVLCLV